MNRFQGRARSDSLLFQHMLVVRALIDYRKQLITNSAAGRNCRNICELDFRRTYDGEISTMQRVR
jgi:hypothetical protein